MSDEKLREAIIYLCMKSAQDQHFGKMKLNKLLWYADAEAYLRLGRSITGAEYQKLEHGPAPRRVPPLLAQLLRDGVLKVEQHPVGTHKRHHLIALRSPRTDLFSGDELAVLDRQIQIHRDENGTFMSEETHNLVGWRLAEMGETIPIGTALISTEPLTDEEKLHALETAKLPEYLSFHGYS